MSTPNLHSQIMNLPKRATEEYVSYGGSTAYDLGHRDARHAAAELGAKADEMIKQLLAACEDVDCECSPRMRESGHRIGCFFPDFKDAIARATGKEN